MGPKKLGFAHIPCNAAKKMLALASDETPMLRAFPLFSDGGENRVSLSRLWDFNPMTVAAPSTPI